ncbi:MAG TPA: hypothetical protein VM537_13785, partial [Anaerolineae bacterium]|nr:hypothetical protein [Anaerolineae bacterium]
AGGSGDGVRNDDLLGNGTVSAEDNWWGCDGFPGDVGCDDTSGPLDSDPRLNLLLSPASASIPQNSSTKLEAAIASSSGAAQADTALNGLTVTFGAGGLAGVSVVSGSDTIAGGLASDIFSCGSTSGSATAWVTLDNGTQDTTIPCVTPPTPTPTATATTTPTATPTLAPTHAPTPTATARVLDLYLPLLLRPKAGP